jgi:hypothetical protein
MLDVILKRFDQPDEIRTFPKGKFELIHIGGLTIGRATYQPGWKWSVDVGAASESRCVRWSMSGWSYQAKRPPQWKTADHRNASR